MSEQPIWSPRSAGTLSHMQKFSDYASKVVGTTFPDYQSLHRWSIDQFPSFWRVLADFVQIKWHQPPQATYIPSNAGTLWSGQWFPGAKLNFAENLLPDPLDQRQNVICGHTENEERVVRIGARELRHQVAQLASFLKSQGVKPGDRVAAISANTPEAIIAMLATASIGGVWSSCSPDFGASAVLDRFKQIEPKVLFVTTHYVYGSKRFDCSATNAAVIAGIPSLGAVIEMNHMGEANAKKVSGRAPLVLEWSDALSEGVKCNPNNQLEFVSRNFDDPLYILFSSGTTGVPKCIVHSVGGTLLQHKKELLLHSDISSADCLFFYTTCGWMMWNWMVSALATGARLVVYDGAVNKPSVARLWDICDKEGVSALGVSPKFLQLCAATGYQPSQANKLEQLKCLLSTGAPLLSEQFDWVYGNVKKDLHLASISGGTDIVSCFMLGHPNLPVHRGEIQCLGLGMAVEAWGPEQSPVIGQKGELVCVQPFVSMPIGFWGDEDGTRYRRAYFEHFDGRSVWRHGDFVEITERGGVIVYGRSDATLNPGGVRIGTAEIYRYVESRSEILDSVVIGAEVDGDTEIVLFVKLQPHEHLTNELEDRIKTTIRHSLTPRHVPKAVYAVTDIPYTRSGKKVELAVSQAFHQRNIANLSAIVNPECLEQFRKIGRQRSKNER